VSLFITYRKSLLFGSVSVTKILDSSTATLTRYIEMILNAIFNSATQCPTVLRFALRQLWINTGNQFKQPEHYVSMRAHYTCVCLCLFARMSVLYINGKQKNWSQFLLISCSQEAPYLAVTSFIFLRFFVPAILSPKLFALRDYHADHRIERTLKLIAKVQGVCLCVYICFYM